MKNIYDDLISLCETNEAFFFKDFERDGHWFRLFNYRLASYTDFLLPSAIECRGIMFEITQEGDGAEYIRLASRPMEKFWNIDENQKVMNLNFEDMRQIMVKEDGSLISTYELNGQLFLKTKGSLYSEQALDAMSFLDRHENEDFKRELFALNMLGYTVNCEWVGPSNRIVVWYESAKLVVLNVRDRTTGEYATKQLVQDMYPEVASRWVKSFLPHNMGYDTGWSFVQNIPHVEGFEGYVLQLSNGQHVKCKGVWYVTLHHCKDSINTPRKLFEAVLEETTDDLRSLFHDDLVAIKMIEDMELLVESIYNPLVARVENYYNHHKHWERKEYAIEGQKVLPNHGEFGLAMSLYIGRPTDFKQYLKKYYREYGIADKQTEENDE